MTGSVAEASVRRRGTPENPARSAILFGAADPIGEATARRMLRAGASVTLCDVNESGLAALARELGEAGAAVRSVAIDPRHPGDPERAMQTALSAFGSVDVLVNGLDATIGDAKSTPDGPGHSADSIALSCMQAAIPVMTAGGGGRIVNLVSSAGRYRSAYMRYAGDAAGATNEATLGGAVLAATRQLGFELAPRRIRVNAVAVGLIRTPETEQALAKLTDREREFLWEELSLRRLGEPDEVATVVEFLASEASSYLTGATIDVNGGWWMS